MAIDLLTRLCKKIYDIYAIYRYFECNALFNDGIKKQLTWNV